MCREAVSLEFTSCCIRQHCAVNKVPPAKASGWRQTIPENDRPGGLTIKSKGGRPDISNLPPDANETLCPGRAFQAGELISEFFNLVKILMRNMRGIWSNVRVTYAFGEASPFARVFWHPEKRNRAGALLTTRHAIIGKTVFFVRVKLFLASARTFLLYHLRQ